MLQVFEHEFLQLNHPQVRHAYIHVISQKYTHEDVLGYVHSLSFLIHSK